ncbi:hypothetical protein E4100_08540 [Soehngenia longivitae]|uniref:4Fe-4S ferredoxin-type domain-containing protein n=1 Tax=Soehngenia longivitae TaxID=2562294 RepID=A0A4Z0D248_9FIRM|nr:hypothetical protein [Soehngenia longivitae]TFZ39388.1 hypothetical protein E4100_08540 [Soehngenia longivitae]
MSDNLIAMNFEKLLDVVLNDYKRYNKIFEIDKKDFYRYEKNISIDYLGNKLASPIGPAAGPHTQLAQNIISAYLTGSRYFEVKTVQAVDGKEMQKMISKPCIDAKNVGYNVEWSTELTVEEAMEQYIYASCLLEAIAKELQISNQKDFIINISVGYDLEGIKSQKVDSFIENLKDASKNNAFKNAKAILKENIERFNNLTVEDVDKISPNISNIVTLSTMHGCKKEEIKAIATHLIENKKMNTFVKLNPTLLGYDNVRKILDDFGYNSIELSKTDFENDLQFDDAVKLVRDLKEIAVKNSLISGIKLTNTLPVYNTRNKLRGDKMYLSGKPLFPIAIGVAKKFFEEFDDLNISFSGGIDKENVREVLSTGIMPVTFSTVLLKPKGYLNTLKIAKEVEKLDVLSLGKLNIERLTKLIEETNTSNFYKNHGEKETLNDELTTFDCFKANCGICVNTCPNRANIKLEVPNLSASYQIIHLDSRCNECGNCADFCPKGGKPYYKKITIFENKIDFNNSCNTGLMRLSDSKYLIRDIEGQISEIEIDIEEGSTDPFMMTIKELIKVYPYLF